MNFQEKVRAFLDSRNASQTWLGEQTGLSKSAVSDFFVKKSRPKNFDDVLAIARLMGMDPLDLMDDSKAWPPATVHRVPELTDEEMEVLKLAKRIGIELATARMLLLPEPGAESRREPEPARESRATSHTQLPTSTLRPSDVRPNRGSSRNG